jgi:serine/threonine protein kinase
MSSGNAEARAVAPDLQQLRAGDPSQLGQYEILGRLGAGGMGIAYLGQGPDDLVVVKVLNAIADLDKGTISRLERELEAMRLTATDRTVYLRDHDLSHDPPWFAMDFVPGPTLKAFVEGGRTLSQEQIKPFALDLALAIADVHRAGVIHRDLKPSNVILSKPHARIIDFGVAATEGGTMLTKTGQIMGTMGWLAPEQIAADKFSEATDVHAWALCVFYAVAGVNPFDAATPGASMFRIVNEKPDTLQGVPDSISALVDAALAKEPTARPGLDAIIEQLESDRGEVHRGPGLPAKTAGPSRRRGRRVFAVAAALAVGMGVLLGYLAAQAFI